MNNIIKALLAIGTGAMVIDAWQNKRTDGGANMGSRAIKDKYWSASTNKKMSVITELVRGMNASKSSRTMPTRLIRRNYITRNYMNPSDVAPLLGLLVLEGQEEKDILAMINTVVSSPARLKSAIESVSPPQTQGQAQGQGQTDDDAALRAQYEALFLRKPLSAQQQSKLDASSQFGFGRTLGTARAPMTAQQQSSASSDSDFGFSVSSSRAPMTAQQQSSASSDSDFGFSATTTGRAPMTAQQQSSTSSDSDFGFSVSSSRAPMTAQQQSSASSDSDFGFSALTVPTFEQFKRNPGKYRK